MIVRTVSHFVEASKVTWKASKVPGVEYVALNADSTERHGTFLLKMAPGVKYPKHMHPEGEEILVLKGEMTVGNRKLKSGDFLYSPPRSQHDAHTESGCMFLSVLPKPIQIVGNEGPKEYESSGEPAPQAPGSPSAA